MSVDGAESVCSTSKIKIARKRKPLDEQNTLLELRPWVTSKKPNAIYCLLPWNIAISNCMKRRIWGVGSQLSRTMWMLLSFKREFTVNTNCDLARNWGKVFQLLPKQTPIGQCNESNTWKIIQKLLQCLDRACTKDCTLLNLLLE